ncbi:hypothetical protein GCM10020369_52360 [Cryptosporangium minutisporangium]|uniref:Uncharacterized protein n=1 Tax=Cryptosporangium minutisporangium TaxID=113569 RepID=A0ABP6T499_9ACTN
MAASNNACSVVPDPDTRTTTRAVTTLPTSGLPACSDDVGEPNPSRARAPHPAQSSPPTRDARIYAEAASTTLVKADSA